MWKEWSKIIVAGLFEVGWVIGITHAGTVLEWTATIIAIVISFYFLINAGKDIPVGTAYAVFVGLGTAGTVVLDVLLFGASMSWAKGLLLLLLLAGIAGLKLASDEKEVSD
ncbi:DMT family transporter [Gracilibacillus salinarum]|uniref:SMR family transporter n=1 Tax=Gracilibacillus salinarum TaxID=2932255 RepID=A0ABY4GR64_9BACI|nr:SMR family transporter [Gracilibacillus salinarum]UOQ86749.1 SMR family transporter [Gracilibacillus salinarum]